MESKQLRNSDEKFDAVQQGIIEEEPLSEEPKAEERRLVFKLDKRILPITCLLYLFAYLDRSNLGNARLMGLTSILGKDNDPTGVLFDWVNSAFFFSYASQTQLGLNIIVFQTPAVISSKLFPPRIWMACCTFGWGVCSTLMATGFNFGGVVVARVFLGFFEAGFGPGIPLYFSLFYTKEEMGLRMAYWFGFAAVAGAFGGLLAFGISHITAQIENWRLLFIVEGIPTIILSLITLLLLPNRPESTTYLTKHERELAIVRMNRGTSGDSGAMVQKKHIVMAFCDWRVYIAGVIYFGLNCSLASISAFLPTIVASLDYSNATAQLFTVPPYAVAAVVLVLFSFVSDRIQSRGIPMAIASTISAIGYLLLLVVKDNRVRYFSIFCLTSGTYTPISLILAWFAHNLGSETKKATGIPVLMAIGQCGSILGSHIFPKTDGPLYIRGYAICCALAWLCVICSLILTAIPQISYRWDNAKRNRLHGVPKPLSMVDTSELADKVCSF
ncbi:Major facilitator superfamily domain containing protein [Amanita muscaria]